MWREQFSLPTILDILANPLILFLISTPTVLIVGVILGTWLSQPRKPKVLQVSPESGRGTLFDIDSEDSVNAYCNPVGNTPPQRFIKRFEALNVIKRGPFKLQNFPMYFARKGTAYTTLITGEKQQPEKVSFREAVLNALGKDLYHKIPNDEKHGFIKDSIEQSELSIMVEFPRNEPLTPLNPNYDPNIKDPQDPRSHKFMTSVSNDDIRRNDINTFIGAVANGIRNLMKGESSGQIYKIIFSIGTGIAIGIVLCLIFKWGAPVVYQNPPNIPTPVNGSA